jgi:D-tyrosyl-tRNA(Tyr) deacylase
MRAVIQRVKNASVTINGRVVGEIKAGMLVFLGVAKSDTDADLDFLVRKVAQIRMFEDSEGKMNLSAVEAKAEFLVVSQFTLLGNCERGRRPSFEDASEPVKAEEMYNRFVAKLHGEGFKVETGVFRAMMDVALVNDGPVTFVLERRDQGQGTSDKC